MLFVHFVDKFFFFDSKERAREVGRINTTAKSDIDRAPGHLKGLFEEL